MTLQMIFTFVCVVQWFRSLQSCMQVIACGNTVMPFYVNICYSHHIFQNDLSGTVKVFLSISLLSSNFFVHLSDQKVKDNSKQRN